MRGCIACLIVLVGCSSATTGSGDTLDETDSTERGPGFRAAIVDSQELPSSSSLERDQYFTVEVDGGDLSRDAGLVADAGAVGDAGKEQPFSGCMAEPLARCCEAGGQSVECRPFVDCECDAPVAVGALRFHCPTAKDTDGVFLSCRH